MASFSAQLTMLTANSPVARTLARLSFTSASRPTFRPVTENITMGGSSAIPLKKE